MPDTTSGLWNAGDVYRRIALGTWVSATPETLTISATPVPSATVTTYSGYIVYTFTSSGTLNVSDGAPGTADVLMVAGGSSGATNPVSDAANGGAGGKVYAVPGATITANSPIPIVVGGTATASTVGPLSSASGSPGGSGGGGAGSAFTAGSPGGSGPTNDYQTGSNQNYSGGGGGGAFNHSPPLIGSPVGPQPGGAGGATGGGPGGPSYAAFIGPLGAYGNGGSPGTNGTVNTGGGGGGKGAGTSYHPGTSGTGGSGIVVIRFPDSRFTT